VKPAPGRSVIVDHGPAGCNAVALTFDAGADRGYAEPILDTLGKQGVPASFGMTGQWAEKNPDLVRRMVAEAISSSTTLGTTAPSRAIRRARGRST